MKMKQYSKQDNKTLIYRYIQKHPYLHFRELARKLQIPKTTLIYHLRYLEKNKFIISNKEGRYTRYCIENNIGNIEKKILNVFRRDTTRDVFLYIMLCVSASQIEISKELGKNPKTIEFHLKKLLDLDIIELAHEDKGIIYATIGKPVIINRKPCKNEIFYRLKEPEKMKLYATLLKYYNKKTINNPFFDSCIEYTEYVSPGDPPKIIKTKKQALETFEKILFEIFPHPYYA